MRDIFYCILIYGLCVGMCLSQDVGGRPQDSQYNVVPEQTEPVPLEDYDDPPEVNVNCYTEENHCSTDINYVPHAICVYKKNMGLTNFYGLCSINLQNCLIRQQKKTGDGSASLDDEIYHNGKHLGCHYYGGNAKSERQAIIWYFKLGGLDAEKEDITQPFNNID